MAVPATQMIRTSPYTFPPPFHHPISRPGYGYNPHHFMSQTNPPHYPTSSTLFSSTSQVLSPNVTLGSYALPITTNNCRVPSQDLAPGPSQGAITSLHSPLGLSDIQPQTSPSSTATSPIPTSPQPVPGTPDVLFSDASVQPPHKSPCSYQFVNRTLQGGSGVAGMGGSTMPLVTCAHGPPLLPGHPLPSSTPLLQTTATSAAMYASPHPDYAPGCMSMNLPTVTGTTCLPPTMPLWNPYPPLPTPNGVMNPIPLPASLPKLTYDSPRYKLTPERAIPLVRWFEEHKDHPYPSRHEKMLLCQATQLTFTQVSTWFANARRRMKKANSEIDEGSCSDDNLSPKGSSTPSPGCKEL